MSPRNTVVLGDARDRLRELPEHTVDCVITSPPYYLMRSYNVPGQLGLEDHVDDWVNALVDVVRELSRVLKPTGSVWLNLGDTYSRREKSGASPKSLLLGPERLALALVGEGWVIRNKIVWAKSNPLPSSATDRLTSSWEYLWLLTRSRSYFFDLDAIREPHRTRRPPRRIPRTVPGSYPAVGAGSPSWGSASGSSGNRRLAELNDAGIAGHPLGKNPGDVWTFGTAAFHGSHYATFPKRLIERPILASCPERVCAACGLPWQREPYRQLGHLAVLGKLRPACRCHASWQPGLVLDPFMGSGTVALVAIELRRDWLGIELNPDYVELARQRIAEAEGTDLEDSADRRAA